MNTPFYINKDLRKSKIYLAPFKVEKGGAYLIECSNLYEAEALIKKLNILGLEPPPKNKADFKKIGIDEEGDRGTVAIYKFILNRD